MDALYKEYVLRSTVEMSGTPIMYVGILSRSNLMAAVALASPADRGTIRCALHRGYALILTPPMERPRLTQPINDSFKPRLCSCDTHLRVGLRPIPPGSVVKYADPMSEEYLIAATTVTALVVMAAFNNYVPSRAPKLIRVNLSRKRSLFRCRLWRPGKRDNQNPPF